jgi:hypothetical protein
MKTIATLLLIAGLFAVLLAYPAGSVSAHAHANEAPGVCSSDEPRDMSNDLLWRWRTHQSLSCLISKLEEVKNRPSDVGRGQVTLTREEAEDLLNLAWSGRDSAQRIAR